LQTGGSAPGEISTRSKPLSAARSSARAISTTPTCSPAPSMRRTESTVMSLFTRGPSRFGGI